MPKSCAPCRRGLFLPSSGGALDPPIANSDRRILLSFMADRFDVMTVWIENVGRKIIRVMFETQARCAIITAAIAAL